MDISLSVNGDTLILGQLFAPGFTAKPVNCPVIAVKAAPQDGATILIYKLLGSYRIIEAFNIHHAYGIVFFASDGHFVASNNIHYFFGGGTRDHIASAVQQTLGTQIHFVAAVVFTKSPVVDKTRIIWDRLLSALPQTRQSRLFRI